MSFASDLLEQATHLAHREPEVPKQASLRRAVSTAYYALFHLLIDEAVNKWAVDRQRSALARTIDHVGIKEKCADLLKRAKRDSDVPAGLTTVAQHFIELRAQRSLADYDNSKQWSRADVQDVLDSTESAFSAWTTIRHQPIAEDFLMQLLFPKLPKTLR